MRAQAYDLLPPEYSLCVCLLIDLKVKSTYMALCEVYVSGHIRQKKKELPTRNCTHQPTVN